MAVRGERSVRTALALLAVDLGVRCLGYGAMRRLLHGPRRSAPASGAPEAPDGPAGSARVPAPGGPARLADAHRAAARRLAARVERSSSFRVYRVPCLPRALLLERLLAARGLPAHLRIGVRRDGAAVRAHAWVECADLVLDPDPRVEERFPALTP